MRQMPFMLLNVLVKALGFYCDDEHNKLWNRIELTVVFTQAHGELVGRKLNHCDTSVPCQQSP